MANVRHYSPRGKSEQTWNDAVRRVKDARRCGGFLIDITSKPSERAEEHGEVYAEMCVLYQTNSATDALRFADALLDKFGDDADNETRCRRPSGKPPYYVYVMLRGGG